MWNSGYPANGLPLDKISLYYQPVVPARKPQKQDIITVVVNLKREFVSDGKVQRQKRSNVQAKLSDWFLLRQGSLKPGLQDGSPSIQGTLNTQFRTQNNMENLDLMRFTIAAKVADVRRTATW